MSTSNTYSFTKSDFAAMLQHVVDLIPELMFLYDPAQDLVVYHNQKKGFLFGDEVPIASPITLRELLSERLLPKDWPTLERNARRLLSLKEKEIVEVRFRVKAPGMMPKYRWCALRQKVFFQDESTGVKLILCLAMEVRTQEALYFEDRIRYS
jgi:hypothetical protein